MSTPRYVVFDRYKFTASELRPRSTMTNPRYHVIDTKLLEVVDEFTTKRPALDAARDLNRASTIVVVDAPDVSPCCGAPTSVDEHAVVYCKRCYAAI